MTDYGKAHTNYILRDADEEIISAQKEAERILSKHNITYKESTIVISPVTNKRHHYIISSRSASREKLPSLRDQYRTTIQTEDCSMHPSTRFHRHTDHHEEDSKRGRRRKKGPNV